MRLSTLRVSARLMLAFGLLLLMSLLSSGLALTELASVQANLEEVVLDNNVKIRHSVAMSEAVHTASRILRSVLLLEDKAARAQELARLTQARADYDQAWSALEKLPAGDAGRAVRVRIAAARDAVRALDDRVLALGLANQPAEAAALLMQQASPAALTWLAALRDNLALQEAKNAARFEATTADYAQARRMLVGTGLLSVALALALGWLVTRSITGQLGAEPAQATRLAQSVAAGDLSLSIALKDGDRSSLMAQLAAMQRSLSQVVGTVRQNADSVATGSNQIAQGNQDLSQRTEEQASALQQTAASMAQLGATVRQNADNARQANALALGASSIAVRGGEVVGQVVDTMKGINDSSRRIADIIGTIDGIAFQTNILALNAAVEAARAGEQGRGFAVVASEVRSLAQRSAEAAREIKALIGASVERVEQGTLLVDQAGATMQEVVGAIRNVTAIMGEINAASAEQSAAVGLVGDAVAQMDEATQHNAALVEESAAAAASLRSQARQLVDVVAAFTLVPAGRGA